MRRLLHGLSDPLLPYNQSELVYRTTTAAANEARLTFVPSAGHSVDDIIDGVDATTLTTNRGGHEGLVTDDSVSWDDIEQFLHRNLSRSRGGR